MEIDAKTARVLARLYDIPIEDVAVVIANKQEVARQSIEDGLAQMSTTVTAPPPIDVEPITE